MEGRSEVIEKRDDATPQSHLGKLQEKLPPMTALPQMPTVLREYAKKINKTASEATAKATEATAKALKTSLAISALSKTTNSEVPLKLEQHLAALHAANEKAQKATWTLCQDAFETSNIRMDNVIESLNFSSENIQEAIHVTKNVNRHFRDLGNTLTTEISFYRSPKEST